MASADQELFTKSTADTQKEMTKPPSTATAVVDDHYHHFSFGHHYHQIHGGENSQRRPKNSMSFITVKMMRNGEGPRAENKTSN